MDPNILSKRVKIIKLLVSEKDIAGMNILNFLSKDLQLKTEIIKEVSIFADSEIKSLELNTQSSIIFLSRHSAKSLRPSLTVHPIGNFSKAEFGGKDSTLVSCDSYLLKLLFLKINQLIHTNEYNISYQYENSLEVTHHGPFTSHSVAYIEVGSSEDQWNDLEACRLIADVINQSNFNELQSVNWTSCIGFGGNHYSTKFTKQMLNSEYAFGHICAKYAIPFLNKELVQQMIQKTWPTPQIAIFDKKSIKRKQEIRAWLQDFNIDIIQV
ncbi:D-aminoacyl-tRNA deacylase [Candidatus Hodarchaeum mangrovi]